MRRTVSLLMITLLLTNMLMLAINSQSVKSEPVTIIVPDDYSTIQEAINNANEGDTIFVRNGTYHEHLVVNKTVFIVGEDRTATILDGNHTGTVISVTADSVNIRECTIQNGETGIELNSNGNTISNNTFLFHSAQSTDLKTDLHVYPNPPVSPVWRYLYDLAEGSYTEWFDLTTETPILGIKVSGYDDVAQLSLGVFYDENMDGIPQLQEFTGIASRDKITWVSVFDPPKGRYIIKVQGYDVAGFPGHFDREITQYRGYGLGAHQSSNSTISENGFAKCDIGTYFQNCSGMTLCMNNVSENVGGIIAGNIVESAIYANNVFSNIASEASAVGIALRASHNVDLSQNALSHNALGISLWNTSYVNVTENELESHLGWSIYCHRSSYNNIVGNKCSNSSVLDGVRLTFSSRNNVKGNDISYCEHSGILLWYDCYDNSITDNRIRSSGSQGWGHGHGIEVLLSHSNIFVNNSIRYARSQGIIFIEASNNSFTENLVYSNRKGIDMNSFSGNRIYHNSIINSSEWQSYDGTGQNSWSDDYPSGGNYWSDYTGTDHYHGFYQNETGSDGIGDTPYAFEGNMDHYPLIFPWSGFTGDINQDGIVDIFDITTVAVAFNSKLGDPNWNEAADIISDGIIDIFDIVVVALHFGETG